jgi:hypothetical protein
METVLDSCLHALVDLVLQSGDDHLLTLQGYGLVGDGPSFGGPFCLLNVDEESSFKRQSPRTSDSMHSTVRGPSSVRGPPSAFSPPLAPSPLAPQALEPPPLGAIIAAAIAAATGTDEARTSEAGHSGGCEVLYSAGSIYFDVRRNLVTQGVCWNAMLSYDTPYSTHCLSPSRVGVVIEDDVLSHGVHCFSNLYSQYETGFAGFVARRAVCLAGVACRKSINTPVRLVDRGTG